MALAKYDKDKSTAQHNKMLEEISKTYSMAQNMSSMMTAYKEDLLAGAAFKNKNDKLGQQDMFKAFFSSELHTAYSFPDTRNTRFQSYCGAAATLLLHLDLYIVFLEQVRNAKTKPSFTNMEANVFHGLQDLATLTKLAVLVLYAEAVCHPYVRRVRTPGTNTIDLGPLHLKVVSHCQSIIDNLDVLLGLDAPSNHEKAILDDLPWEHANVVNCIHSLAQSGCFPHLRGALVASFKGA
ncbi:hypothetical protein AURDEDRAFT_175862 [Auricularia subglabra TFB-10046 SS5]|nr:hypothetical protein AURDEDRAFT_175862 [Auricularia subglabra TFB-10046 SS5]